MHVDMFRIYITCRSMRSSVRLTGLLKNRLQLAKVVAIEKGADLGGGPGTGIDTLEPKVTVKVGYTVSLTISRYHSGTRDIYLRKMSTNGSLKQQRNRMS